MLIIGALCASVWLWFGVRPLFEFIYLLFAINLGSLLVTFVLVGLLCCGFGWLCVLISNFRLYSFNSSYLEREVFDITINELI